MKNLPIYELVLKADNPDSGVVAISIVDKPAIEQDFIKMSKVLKLSSHDDDKKILTGLAMIPEMPIYRKEGKEEFYVQFSKSTIREAAAKFMERSDNFAVTLQHKDKTFDVSIIESWIIEDSKQDKLAALGLHAPVGGWAISMRVHDDDMWDEVKNGDVFNGFSIEGFFDRININQENFIEMAEEKQLWERMDSMAAKFSELEQSIKNQKTPDQIRDEIKEDMQSLMSAYGFEKKEPEVEPTEKEKELMSKIEELASKIQAFEAAAKEGEEGEEDEEDEEGGSQDEFSSHQPSDDNVVSYFRKIGV